MYQSLYRKYRPANFDEMVGQEVIIQTLRNTISHNKLSHAYLFTGPRGTGKTSVAKILAKTVNCENPINGIPCEKCINCIQFNQKQSTDIIEIDAASNNGVDEIRELKSKINTVPTSGKYKIYIIDEVHMLTTGAFNALLKTLEEPPMHILFVLATTEPHKIPATILSRCQRFDFKKISIDSIVKRLTYIAQQEQINVDSEALLEIARLADGGLRDSLSTLDQVIAYAPNNATIKDVHEINGTITPEELKQLVLDMIESNIAHIFELLDKYDSEGKNFIKLTEEIINFLRNVLLSIHVPNYLHKVTNNSNIYEELKTNFDQIKTMEWIKAFNTTILDMKNSNSPRIIFELTIIQLVNINSKPEKNKISRLQEKENEIVSKMEKKETVLEEKKDKSQKISQVNETYNNNLGNTSDKILNILNKLKNIRVNNTLCNFDRKQFLDTKNRLEEVQTLLLDDKYNHFASLVLDGELKAASNDHLIFIYPSNNMVEEFNQLCYQIDDMMEYLYQIPFKTIATTEQDWNYIKQEFNSKQKQYTYMEEPKTIKDELQVKENKEANSIDSMFGTLVEYH